MTITYSSNTKTYHSKKNSDIFTIAKWKRYIILSIIKKFAEFSYKNNIWQYITLSLLIKLVNDIYILLNSNSEDNVMLSIFHNNILSIWQSC